MITHYGNIHVTSINNRMKIHSKTKKVLKNLLRFNISKIQDLNVNLSKICDSLKYLELILLIEKESKRKILKTKIIKIKDINNFFHEK